MIEQVIKKVQYESKKTENYAKQLLPEGRRNNMFIEQCRWIHLIDKFSFHTYCTRSASQTNKRALQHQIKQAYKLHKIILILKRKNNVSSK